MKLLLIVDSHVFRTPDNRFYCKGITDYTFFSRYLSGGFNQVDVIARVLDVKSEDVEGYIRADGKGVNFLSVAFARGSKDYIVNYRTMNKQIARHIQGYDHAIFRLPSILAFMVLHQYTKKRKAFYGIELVADCFESFKDNKFMQWFFTNLTKKYCKGANGVSYVTEYYLQKFYPSYSILKTSDSLHFDTFYSSIELSKDFIGDTKQLDENKELVITHIANKTSSTSKGQDVLIKTLHILLEKGLRARICFIGDSEIREYYYDIAKSYGIEDKIEFTGLISDKSEMRKYLITSDIYIFPTVSEGLPRSVIEAMATGLPCVASAVGGIPELLDPGYLVENQQDYKKFAQIAFDVLNDKEKYYEVSKRNIEKSKQYLSGHLNKKREEFYRKIASL